MMKKKMEKALNDQIKYELESAYLYYGMSAYFEGLGFKGFAAWMRLQAKEEIGHVGKFYDYLFNREASVVLPDLSAPKMTWSSPEAAFKDGLTHEKKISQLIHDLVDLSVSEKDHATNGFLRWFVDEQIEEEAVFQDILHKFSLIGSNKAALLMLDRELGQRSSTA